MKPARWTSLLLAAGLTSSVVMSACGSGSSGAPVLPPPPPPVYTYAAPADKGDGWTAGNAADNAMATGILEDMMNDIRAGLFPFVDSIAIARNGVLVFEETIRSVTDSRDASVNNQNPEMHAMFSVSKSITSLLVGISIDEGHISSVDAPYLGLFPYPSYSNPDVRKDSMTLEHVLTMRTGIDWDEWDPPYSSVDNQWIRFIADETDFSKAFLDLPMAADPGTAFAYSTAASVSLGQAIENAAPTALIDFGVNELMLPLGITDIEILTTPTGLPNGGSGFFLLTRDAAKFGQLILNGGTWNNERIVSEAWLDESLTARTDIAWANPDNFDWVLEGYGYQWWTGYYDLNGVRLDSYAAWGYGGQWIISIPAVGLVVAINSQSYDGDDAATNEAHALVRQYILASLATL